MASSLGGLRPGKAVPDANALWDFRAALIATKALDGLFETLARVICHASALAMGGQMVNATLAAAQRQRKA